MKNKILILLFLIVSLNAKLYSQTISTSGYDNDITALIPGKPAKAFKITHSASYNIVGGNTALCNSSQQYHYENSYYLAYDLKNDFNINGDWIIQRVDVAVEKALAGNNISQPLIVKLWVMSYYNHREIIQDSLTLLAADTVQIYDTDTGNLKTIDFTNDVFTVKEGKTLVVEFMLPDGQQDNNLMFLGSNNDRISDSTYIKAPYCNVNEPVNVSEIMFPDMMIIADIFGEYASPNPQIQSFFIEGQLTDTEIKNNPDYTVKVIMPADTSLNALTPVILIPAGFRITPASEEVTDFSQGPVTYTVDNNFNKVSQSWQVSVENAGPDITGAYLPEINGDVIISGNPDYTVTIPVTEGSDITNLSPEIYVFKDFETNPLSGSAQDFSNGAVTYTVSHSFLPLSQDWLVSVVETPALGIKKIKNNQFKIYPNPANDILTVKGENIKKIIIFDISGKKIIETNKNKINIAKLKQGYYFIKILNNSKYFADKFLIVR